MQEIEDIMFQNMSREEELLFRRLVMQMMENLDSARPEKTEKNRMQTARRKDSDYVKTV